MLSEKEYLPAEQYAYIVECLEEEVDIESCLRALCQYDLDLCLAETWAITGLVTGLMQDETYGVIAEWLVRQWSISCGEEEPLQPRKIHVPRNWTIVGRRCGGKKAKSLGLVFRKKLMQKKIKENESLYRKEKELEENFKKESSPFKIPNIHTIILLKRGQKRNHQQTIIN